MPDQPSPHPNTHPRKARAIIQLIAIQARLFADIERDDTSAMARAQSARAWKELQDLRLRMKMIPAPKPVEVLELRAAKVGGSFPRAKVQARIANAVAPQNSTDRAA
jgi:hypothetical protein